MTLRQTIAGLHMARRPERAAARLAFLAGAAVGLIAGTLIAGSAQAQTGIKLSLDERLEGPAGLFLLPQDRGYYRSEGLDVTIEEGSGALDPITRVASGGYELGFADINALIRYRDQNPAAPVKAVFMLYNKPPFAIVGRKSRGITDPKSLEDKKLGAPPAGATYDQWPIFAKLNDIDAGKVAVEQIGVPVRAPMLAAGQLDAVLGYSFRVYVDLKDRGVPVDDVVLLPMANYGLKLYGGAIIVNSKFAADEARRGRGLPARLPQGAQGHDQEPVGRGQFRSQARGPGEKGGRARAAADGDPGQYRHPGSARQRPGRASTGRGSARRSIRSR